VTRGIGIDVGGTFLKAVVIESAPGAPVEEILAEYRREVPAEDLLGFVTDTAESLVAEHDASGLGVGVAGLVRWPEGEFVWGPHLVGQAVPFRRHLSDRLGRDVAVDNDANLAAYAEASAGAAKGRRHVLMLTFGTGIGAGIVVDGRIYRGRSFAGEMGHITMQPEGRLCACGRRGCWETFVSGSRLDDMAAELVARAPEGLVARLSKGIPASGAHLTEAAGSGDAAARAILADAGTWLGRGVADLVAILDPDVVVVGGAVVGAGDWLLDAARRAIASQVEGAAHRPPVELVTAEYGPLAGAVGAALAGLAAHEGLSPEQTGEVSR
jgi:glucokinase